jgi:hypothetical protein
MGESRGDKIYFLIDCSECCYLIVIATVKGTTKNLSPI